MPEITLESLAARLEALEQKFAGTSASVIPPSRDWRSVVGLSEENDFTRQMRADLEARREAERAAARAGIAE